MDESQSEKEELKRNYSRDEVVSLLAEARKRTGFGHIDDLKDDDPAVEAYISWCAQPNPYIGLKPPKAAEYQWDLDKTMAYFDAGFDDPDYLDELSHDFLIQYLDNAEADRDEAGMGEVIERITDAIAQIESKMEPSGQSGQKTTSFS